MNFLLNYFYYHVNYNFYDPVNFSTPCKFLYQNFPDHMTLNYC